MNLPSPSFPACSAAPPCRILVRTFSPSGGACPAAALPIPPALLPMPTGAALEPSRKTKISMIHKTSQAILFLSDTSLAWWYHTQDSPMPVIGGVAILEVGGAVGIPTDDFIPVVEAEVVVTIFACAHSEKRRGLGKCFSCFSYHLLLLIIIVNYFSTLG